MGGRLALLGYMAWWLLIFAPSHHRGAISLDNVAGDTGAVSRAVMESGAVRSCCSVKAPEAESDTTPKSKPSGTCHICQLIKLLVEPPDRIEFVPDEAALLYTVALWEVVAYRGEAEIFRRGRGPPIG